MGVVTLVALALAASTIPALASPRLNLAWDTCVGDGGTSYRTFACNTNANTGAAANVLVPSILLDAPVELFVGFDTHIRIVSCGTTPAWWGRTCSAASSSWITASTHSPCSEDAYQGMGYGGLVPLTGTDLYPWSGAMYVRTAFGLMGSDGLTLAPGEYPTTQLTISNANTTGEGACAGCTDPAYLMVTEVTYGQAGGYATSVHNGNSTVVYWNFTQPLWSWCIPVPTRSSTWGAVKSLYR